MEQMETSVAEQIGSHVKKPENKLKTQHKIVNFQTHRIQKRAPIKSLPKTNDIFVSNKSNFNVSMSAFYEMSNSMKSHHIIIFISISLWYVFEIFVCVFFFFGSGFICEGITKKMPQNNRQ